MSFLSVEKVTKTFKQEHQIVTALREVSFELNAGDSLAICGPSGAGKSTLMNLIGGLEKPSSGRIIIDQQDITQLSERSEAEFRSHKLGFVFQFHHLLNDFTVVENVMMPLLINKAPLSLAREQAVKMLDQVGIVKLAERFPRELSGGEQQRAAIARALVHRPQLILADEPTGNLDDANGGIVFDLLCALNRDLRATLIVVTHHDVFAKKMNQILWLDSGRQRDLKGHPQQVR